MVDGETVTTEGTLIGTFENGAIALNANALPTGFNEVKTIKFDGTHTGYTLGLDSTDTTIQTQAFQFTDGNKATFTADNSVFTFTSPTYSEYFTAANDTITAHPKIDSQTFKLTIDSDKFTAYSGGSFNVTAGDTAGNFTLGDFGSVTATASTDGNGSISGFVFNMNDNFLGQIAQGGKVELSGGTFADITATATVATDATTKATDAATFSDNTYTAQITAGDYFSKNNTATEIEHVAQVGGQKFTLSGDGLNANITIDSFTVDNAGNVYLKAEAFSGDDGKSITLTDDNDDIGGTLVYKLAYDTDGTNGLKQFNTNGYDYAASKTEVITDTASLQTLTYKAAGKNEGITIDGNTATYKAATGGEPFTLSGLYVPAGYTLDVDATTGNIIATKAEAETITLATFVGGVVTLNKAAFNEKATAAQTVTLTDNTDDDVTYTLQFNDTTTKENKPAEFTYDANKGVVYTAAMETAYYAATDGASNSYTFTPQANGQQFIISGLNGIDTSTITTDGNILQAKLTGTNELVDIGSLDNNDYKFTLTNVAALGTVSDSGAAIFLQNVAPVGSATAIDYTLGFNGFGEIVSTAPGQTAGNNYTKADAAADDGTYTYTYTAAYTPAYTLMGTTDDTDIKTYTYTYHKEEAHDVVTISGLKDVDNFSNLISKSNDGKFTLSEGILPDADGTISLTATNTSGDNAGSYTLGLGTDVATKSYQVSGTAGGSIANGAYTPPTFRAYYEVAQDSKSIATHASIAAPTSAPFTISGLGNYTATYTNNENGGGTATIENLGTIAIDESGNYTVTLYADALDDLVTGTAKTFELTKTNETDTRTFNFSVVKSATDKTTITSDVDSTGNNFTTKTWTATTLNENANKASYQKNVAAHWTVEGSKFTYQPATTDTLFIVSGLNNATADELNNGLTVNETNDVYSVTIPQAKIISDDSDNNKTISIDGTGNKLIITPEENTTVGTTATQVDAGFSGTKYSSAYNKAYFEGDAAGAASYTYHIAQTPSTFEITGLTATTLTLDDSGNVKADETTIGTFDGSKFTLNSTTALAGTASSDNGQTFNFTATKGTNTEAKDYTFEVGSDFGKVETAKPTDIGGTFTKGDTAAADGTYAYSYDMPHTPKYTLKGDNSYTFYTEAAYDTITISGLANVDDFNTLITRSGNQFTLSKGILPTVADGAEAAISLSSTGTGSYTLGLADDINQKERQVADETIGGTIGDDGTYTTPQFIEYYTETNDKTITAHGKTAATTPFKISGLTNCTVVYHNGDNPYAEIKSGENSLGRITFDDQSGYQVQLLKSGLETIVNGNNPVEFAATANAGAIVNLKVVETIGGDTIASSTVSEGQYFEPTKGWGTITAVDASDTTKGYTVDYKNLEITANWKVDGGKFTYQPHVDEITIFTFSGLKDANVTLPEPTAIEGGYSVSVTQDLLNTVEGAEISVGTGNTLTITTDTNTTVGTAAEQVAAALAGSGDTYTYTAAYDKAYFAGTVGGNSYTYHAAKTPDTFSVRGLKSDYSNAESYTLVVENGKLIARPTSGTDVTLGTLDNGKLSLSAEALPTLNNTTTIKLTSDKDFAIAAIGEYSLEVLTPANVLRYDNSTYTFKQNYHADYFKPNTDATAKSSYTFVPTANDGTFMLSGTALANAAIPANYKVADYVTVDADKKVTLKSAILKSSPTEDDTISISGDYTLNNPLAIATTQAEGFYAGATDGTLDYKLASTAAGYEADGTGFKYKAAVTGETSFSITGLPATLKDYTFSVNGNEIIATKDGAASVTLGTFDKATNAVTLKQELWTDLNATPGDVSMTAGTLTITKGTSTVADSNSAATVADHKYGWTAATPTNGVATYEQHKRDELWTKTAVNSYKFNAEVAASTLFTLSGLASNATLADNMVSDKTVTLNANALTTADVTFNSGGDDYKLAVDSTVVAPKTNEGSESWSAVENNQATFYGTTTSEGWTLDTTNNKITYSAGKNGDALFTLTGLADNAMLDKSMVSGKNVNVTTILPTATNTTLTLDDKTSTGYALTVDSTVNRVFTSNTAEGIVTAAKFEDGKFTSSHTDQYYLNTGTTFKYEAGKAATSFKLSGVTIPADADVTDEAIGTYVTISGDIVTVKAAAIDLKTYTGEKIALTEGGNYTLALDSSLLLTDDKKHAAAFTKGTETGNLAQFNYKGAFNDAHFGAVTSNTATFVASTESQAATFTVSNLSKDTDVAKLLATLEGTTLTLTTELLPSATDIGDKKVTINNGYTLQLATGIQPAAFSDQFTGDNGTYTFTAGGKLQGFYNENGEIVYHAADGTTYFTEETKKTFTLTGLATNLGELSLVNGEIISSTLNKAIGTLDGTTVTLNSAALTTGNVALETSYGYALAVDSTVVAPIVSGTDGWSAVVNGKASYSTATTTEGWTLDGNKIKYTAANVGDGELFTISGLRKGITTLMQDGNNIMSDSTVIGTLNKDTKVITLNTDALPTAKDDTYVEIISDDYKLELGELPVASTLVDEKLTLSGTTANYRSPSREAGYVLSGDKQLLTYAATNSTTFTITGLKSGLGTLTLDGDDIKAGGTVIGTFNKNTGVITLNKNALSTGTTKLTGDGYSLELTEGLTEVTTTEGKFTAVDAANGTATYTTTAISDYYTSTAANTFTYVAAVDSANLVINGLKGDALEINSVADHIAVTNEDKVISVTINDRTLLGEETVTFTKPAGYTLKLNANHSITTGAVDGNGRWYYSGGNICAYTVGDIQEYYNVVGETLEYVPATHKDSNQRLVLSGVSSTNLTSEDIEFSEAAGTVTFKKNLGNIVQVLKNSVGYKYIFADGVEPFRFIGAGTDDTINITGNDMTIHGGDGNDVISFAEGTTDGVVELSGGNDTIAYDTNYKIKFHGTRSQKVIGNDVVFSYGSTSLTVTDALGKPLNIINASGTESTLKIFENYDSMLTYSDNRKYGVTLNGSAEVRADSSKKLFTEDSLKSTGYSGNVISIKASDSMTKSVFIEGNAVSNFVIGNNRSGNTLNGGKGNDSIIGGTGADVFYYKSGDGNDTISNYESKDTIMLVDLTDKDITGDKVSVSGNDLVYTLGQNKLRVQNVFSSSDKAAVKLITDDGNALNYTYDKSKGIMTSGNTIGLLASATTYAVTAGETITGYRPDVVLTGITIEDLAKTNVRVATNTITLGLNSGDSVVISGIDTSDQLNLNGTVYTVGKNYLSTDETKYILTSGNVDGMNLTDATSDSTINAILTGSDIEIVGGARNDQLIGGKGNDQFTGNAGSDVFIYSGGNDTINDYDSTQGDVISLNAALNFADITFEGDDLTINGATGNSLAIKNGTGKMLTIDDGTGAKAYTFQDDSALNADGSAITLNADHGNYTASDNVSSIDASAAANGAVITARDANSFITAGNKGLTLVGGTGKDTLLDGTGNSKLTGNAGDDLFIIGGGDDTITDYGTSSDSVTLTDYTMNDLTGVTKSGKNVALTFGSDKLKIDSAVDVITIDGKGYKFDNEKAITNDNKGVILVTESTVDLSTAYTDAQTILANGGGKITAATKDVTMGGKGVTLVGGTGKDTFIYSGDDMNIQNYDAANDVISLSAGYSINDSQVSGSTVTLTITDGTNNGSMTIDVGKSNSFVVKTDKGDEPLYLKKIDFAFDDDDPEIATAVTVVADKGDFGVQGDSLDSGTTKDEFYQDLESITATKENSTLIGNANCNNFYVKGGGANVLTGGIGKDYFVFNSGGGVITDYGSGSTKLGDRTALAGSTMQTTSSGYVGYDRTNPATYKQAVDVLQVKGTVKEIAYTGYGYSNTKYEKSFTAYVTYEDNNGDDYVIKLDNIYKTPTKYGSSPNYRTDDYVAARFQIWDTSSDGSTMARLTLTDDLFTSDVTAAENLLTDLMSAKPLTTTGNMFGSSNPLTSNSSNSNSAPVVVNTNGDKNNG